MENTTDCFWYCKCSGKNGRMHKDFICYATYLAVFIGVKKKITYLTINNLSYLKIQYHEKLYKSITLFFIVQVSG